MIDILPALSAASSLATYLRDKDAFPHLFTLLSSASSAPTPMPTPTTPFFPSATSTPVMPLSSPIPSLLTAPQTPSTHPVTSEPWANNTNLLFDLTPPRPSVADMAAAAFFANAAAFDDHCLPLFTPRLTPASTPEPSLSAAQHLEDLKCLFGVGGRDGVVGANQSFLGLMGVDGLSADQGQGSGEVVRQQQRFLMNLQQQTMATTSGLGGGGGLIYQENDLPTLVPSHPVNVPPTTTTTSTDLNAVHPPPTPSPPTQPAPPPTVPSHLRRRSQIFTPPSTHDIPPPPPNLPPNVIGFVNCVFDVPWGGGWME
ncbi:hypothetical protein HDU67_007029, partial [Dinochytrium kinnereticum]